ncbi:GH32 C-terminal domain-containing protein, partial [Algoriphagus sp. NF]|uniref:GH32 C-terminal domain-containing protein n=1 Tax=Algoriphagus sp. NF TaxID=2992756 RepID=UPI00237B4425
TMAGNGLTLSNELVEIVLEISEENFEVFLSNNQGNRIIIGKNETGIYLDRGQSGLTEFNEEFKTLHNAPDLGLQYKKLKLFIDRSSIEVFFNDGEQVMSEVVFPNSPYTRLETQGFGNTVKVHQLKSIW